jgi:hypothetical protein
MESLGTGVVATGVISSGFFFFVILSLIHPWAVNSYQPA